MPPSEVSSETLERETLLNICVRRKEDGGGTHSYDEEPAQVPFFLIPDSGDKSSQDAENDNTNPLA